MLKFKKIINDILHVSKVTKTRNKKILILTSVALSQLTAFTDVLIISMFAYIISGELVNNEFIDNSLNTIFEISFSLPFLVIIRFIFMFYQAFILKKIELNVSKNLRVYILKDVIEKRNYSMADTYFYVNALSDHISFFYSSFASLINSTLQIFAYATYLIVTDLEAVTVFGIGIIFLVYPIIFIVKKARLFMHESYVESQNSSYELQRVVENLFLIKVLKMERFEIEKFASTMTRLNYNILENHKYGLYNNFIPNFFALFIISVVLSFTAYSNLVTLVFIGVTLRLFQSLSGLTNATNRLINSQVHIEKFYQMEKNKISNEKQNFKIDKTIRTIGLENVSFKYFNSDQPIFKKLSFELEKNKHTIITGQNGSGKSTLLGLISGVFYPISGQIVSFTDKFAYIGANPLIFDSTIYENLMYGNKNEIKEIELLNYLKKLDVFKEESNYFLEKKISNKSLSSGQMQKIAFIRALLSDAEVLLLDEATSNLDKKTKSEIFSLVQERGFTIVNSTHLEEDLSGVDSHLEITVENEIRIINKIK